MTEEITKLKEETVQRELLLKETLKKLSNELSK